MKNVKSSRNTGKSSRDVGFSIPLDFYVFFHAILLFFAIRWIFTERALKEQFS